MSQNGPVLTDPWYLELRDRFAGLLVLVISMALCVAFSIWAKGLARPEHLLRKSPMPLQGISGWPHGVDALGTLEAARRSSRPRELRQIVLDGVKSDGTIDVVTAPGALTYVFHNAARKLTPRQPNEPAVVEKTALCPRQSVRVGADGIEPQPETKGEDCPAATSEPLALPACGPREIWAKAISKGASIRQLAHLEYYRSKAGPTWKMTLPKDRLQLTLTSDCQRELNKREASPL